MQDNRRKTDSLSTMRVKLNEATNDIKSLKLELRNANDELQELKIKCEEESERLVKYYKKQITETITEELNKSYYKLSDEIAKEISRFDNNYELLSMGLENLKMFVDRKVQQTNVAELYSVNLDKIKSQTCFSNAFWEQFEEETKISVILCAEELIKERLSVVKTLNYTERFAAMLKYITYQITIEGKDYYKVTLNMAKLSQCGDTLKISHRIRRCSIYLQSQINNTNIKSDETASYGLSNNRTTFDVPIAEFKRRGFIIDNTVLLFTEN